MTIIAFGSMYHKGPVPPFEWRGVLRDISANKLYVRDLRQCWYQHGLEGLGDDPQAASAAVARLLAAHGPQHSIAVGESMGGYAAILFGSLLGSVEVHAFAPQTFLPGRKGRIFWQTVRRRYWRALISQARLQLDLRIDQRYFDLRPLILDTEAKTTYHVYYCADNPRDVQHAAFIGDLSPVQLHRRESGGHHISKIMRDSGELTVLIDSAVARVAAKSAQTTPEVTGLAS